MTKNFILISIFLFQLTVHGIAGNHGPLVPKLVVVVPNKGAEPDKKLNVEVLHVQEIK